MSSGGNPQAYRAVAVVGVGAILPDAPDAPTFWQNIQQGRYSISEVSPDRWNPDDYYHPDPTVPDKTYSKIGGWVREYAFDPLRWRMPVPPKVLEVMDDGQKWAVATCWPLSACHGATRLMPLTPLGVSGMETIRYPSCCSCRKTSAPVNVET